MRHHIIPLLILLPGIALHAQTTVTNNAPLVTVDYYKTLFIGIDNPVSFSTGKYTNAEMTIDNGMINRSDSSGQCSIRPERVGDAILKIRTNDKTYEFVFRVRSLPLPRLDLLGPKTMDGVPEFKWSKGVIAFIPNFYYDLRYTVDSFTISFSGKGFEEDISRTNIGSMWDSETLKLIDRCKFGTEILISHAYITGPTGRPITLRDQMPFRIY